MNACPSSTTHLLSCVLVSRGAPFLSFFLLWDTCTVGSATRKALQQDNVKHVKEEGRGRDSDFIAHGDLYPSLPQ